MRLNNNQLAKLRKHETLAENMRIQKKGVIQQQIQVEHRSSISLNTIIRSEITRRIRFQRLRNTLTALKCHFKTFLFAKVETGAKTSHRPLSNIAKKSILSE